LVSSGEKNLRRPVREQKLAVQRSCGRRRISRSRPRGARFPFEKMGKVREINATAGTLEENKHGPVGELPVDIRKNRKHGGRREITDGEVDKRQKGEEKSLK